MGNKAYIAEIISVGTEILLGHVANTDARDISYMLSEIGINVKFHTVVGDNRARIEKCVKAAKERADIIITTGGLGPTCDDLTKTVLAESFGLRMQMNEHEKEILYEYISTRGYSMAVEENHLNQALLPEGCTVFHNDWGTAPGCAFEKDGKVVIMVPGPPKECCAMFRECAVPYLRSLSDEYILSHTINVLGIAESRVDRMFRDEMNAMNNPTLAPYAREADCFLKVTAKARNREEAEKMIRPIMEHCCELLGDRVYGIDVSSVEEALCNILRECGKTVAVAEGCTGGNVTRRLTDLHDAGTIFKGGVVAYNDAALIDVLSVPEDTVTTFGGISIETAKAMAENVRRMFGADFGIGICGVSETDGDDGPEIGTLFLGLATEEGVFCVKLNAGKLRTSSYIRCIAANYAYDMVRRYIKGLPLLVE